MEAQHTSGPWEAVGNLVRSTMAPQEGLPRGVQIADCRDNYFLPHTDEARANARLIAAAPELLESLREVLAYCEEAGIDWMCLVQARAAIARATQQTT